MTWKTLDRGVSPYMHWFGTKERFLLGPGGERGDDPMANSFFEYRKINQEIIASKALTDPESREARSAQLNQHLADRLGATGLPFLPDTVGPPEETIDIGSPKLPDAKEFRELSKAISENAVITAVIDIGISPVHQRFRHTENTTRVLSSWQQSGQFSGSKGRVPFGSETLKGDIDEALSDPNFDEAQFFADAGLVRPDLPYGSRNLDFRLSHGTHMADLACGDEPGDQKDLIAAPILAVNMPSKYVIGSAGTYLTTFAFAALIRVIAFADQLWEHMDKNRKDQSKWKGIGGFPLVVNFSFGMQAGPKTGNGWFEALVESTKKQRTAPVEICVPAGNDNLSRASARGELNSKDLMHCIPWRIPPADRSSNFVEIWTQSLSEERDDLEFMLTTPDGTSHGWFECANHDPDDNSDQFKNLGSTMTIYRVREHRTDAHGKATVQYRVVLAMLPTDTEAAITGRPEQASQAGLWKIQVQTSDPARVKREADRVDIFLHIQSDQDIRPGLERTSLRSYFDHRNYDTHTSADDPLDNVPIGMPRDSYHLVRAKPKNTKRLDHWDYEGPVQRKGSQNALATNQALFVLGAYRLSDETPSAYSSTAQSERAYEKKRITKNDKAPIGITALFPGDDGPMHPGLVGAGSKSGSVVTLQGTSGATALATREIARIWATSRSTPVRKEDLLKIMIKLQTTEQGNRAKYTFLKSGAGVFQSSHYTKETRHRPGW